MIVQCCSKYNKLFGVQFPNEWLENWGFEWSCKAFAVDGPFACIRFPNGIAVGVQLVECNPPVVGFIRLVEADIERIDWTKKESSPWDFSCLNKKHSIVLSFITGETLFLKELTHDEEDKITLDSFYTKDFDKSVL